MEGESPGASPGAGRKAALPPSPKGAVRKKKVVTEPTMLKTAMLSTLASQKTSEKFSFGKASRFQVLGKAREERELGHSKSSPAWSHQTSTNVGSDDGCFMEASQDFTSAEPSRVLSMLEPSVEVAFAGGSDDEEEFCEDAVDSPIMRHPPPPETDRLYCTRLEGSLDRLGEPRQRAALPRAKSYDPAQTLGVGTCAAYNHSPHFTFGGGPSRDPKGGGQKEHLAHITNTASKKKGRGKPSLSAVTLMDLKEAIRPRDKPQAPLSRGFGSEVRLNIKNGAMAMPFSPGPGAYPIARDSDPAPVWLSRSHGPQCRWSNRTGDRPSMRNRTGNPPNIGPGDHTDDHSFKATGPTPVFGHPIQDLSKPEWAGTEPTRYTLLSTLSQDRSPAYTVGKGNRGDDSKAAPKSPGPAKYNPKDDLMFNTSPNHSFSKSERVHQSELVDPDEPPGPGSHTVRRDPKPSDKPSAGLPKDVKMRHVPGIGPMGPGPGDSFKNGLPSFLDKKAVSMGIQLPRPAHYSPGPGEHDVMDSLCHDTAPSWGTLVNRSSVRKPPWREVEQPPVFQLKSGETLTMGNVPNKFKSGGPRYTMMPRRDEYSWNLPGKHRGASEAMVVTSGFEALGFS